jgi:hypothetical protein
MASPFFISETYSSWFALFPFAFHVQRRFIAFHDLFAFVRRPHVHAHDAEPPVRLRAAGGEQNFHALLSRDGRWLVSFGVESEAALWDLSARHPEQTRRTLRTKAGTFAAGAISPDSHWLITGTRDGEIRIFDLTAPAPEQSAVVLSARGYVDAIVISPDSRWFITNGLSTFAWRLGVGPLLDLAARTAGRALTDEERQLYNAPPLPASTAVKHP